MTASLAGQELYWIYDSRTGRYAAIHRAGCGFCNHGQGVGGGYNHFLALWRGPFRSLDEAAQHVFASLSSFHQMRYCRRCCS